MADWTIKGKWIEACNCNVGCPCNLNGFPTHGKCEGAVALKVESGNRDGIDLSGVKVAAAVKWPGAIHEGNGHMAVIIDADNDEQRDAMVKIMTNEDGGMPWEILATTVSEIAGPFFEPVEFEDAGTKTKVRSGDRFNVALEAFRNPVTDEEHQADLSLPGGFIWQEGQLCTTSAASVSADGVSFDHGGNHGVYCDVEWSNAAAAAEVSGTKF